MLHGWLEFSRQSCFSGFVSPSRIFFIVPREAQPFLPRLRPHLFPPPSLGLGQPPPMSKHPPREVHVHRHMSGGEPLYRSQRDWYEEGPPPQAAPHRGRVRLMGERKREREREREREGERDKEKEREREKMRERKRRKVPVT